ncbi:MAG: phytase [Bacteroidota bacterium]
MTYSSVSKSLIVLVCSVIVLSCGHPLAEIPPKVITEQTPHDTDDPAIWINRENPEESIVFGTDKDEINGGVYAYNLDGKIIRDKSITGLSYPNNVDLAYGFKLPDSTQTDIIMFTEREKNQVRLFSVPDMQPLDGGGFPVFEDESSTDLRRPMGIGLFKDPNSGNIFPIVSRKAGPKDNYLYQYQLVSDSLGIDLKLVRKFGNYSGKKEIEAVAVDNELGHVYYSDEMHCIHKYYAHPDKGNKELACFGAEYFKRDVEGIAIANYQDGSGYLIVSDQQAHSFSVFDRESNAFISQINLGTIETDGCDVTTTSLGSKFPSGLFVSMTDSKEFYFHDFKDLVDMIGASKE